MNKIKTNTVEVIFDFEKIHDDFEIFRITTSEKFLKYGSMVLDEAVQGLQARSVVFEGGRSFYCLLDKGKMMPGSFIKQIRNWEEGDSMMVEQISSVSQLKSISAHLLAQLFFNSLAAPRNELLSYNNISGSLLYIDPEVFKRSSKDSQAPLKIPTIKIRIDRQMLLQLELKTYSSLAIKSKLGLKKPLKEYPQYTIVYATRSLRRVLHSEKLESRNRYILKQEKGRKSSLSFLSIKDPESFINSKMGILYAFHKEIESKLSPYLELSFLHVSPDQSLRFDKQVSREKAEIIHEILTTKGIHIVDKINDEESANSVGQLEKSISKHYPGLLVTQGRRSIKSHFNLILIHNSDYYKKYAVRDPYASNNPAFVCQHITMEDFKTDSRAVLDNAIKELCIKHDVISRRISLKSWSQFGFRSNWIFGQRVGDVFYFMEIKPDGTFDFKSLKVPSFDETRYQKYVDSYLDFENAKGNPAVEGIIISGGGDVNLICSNGEYTLPGFQAIGEIFEEESAPISILKEELLSHLSSFLEHSNQGPAKGYLKSFQDSPKEQLSRKDILDIVKHRTIRKAFTKYLHKETGFLLRSYFKDADTRFAILDSNLDIKYYTQGNSGCFFVGTKGEGIQSNFPNASRIRKIVPLADSRLLFHDLLPTMNVDFVKNQDITVLPFPFKYLRENVVLSM